MDRSGSNATNILVQLEKPASSSAPEKTQVPWEDIINNLETVDWQHASR
jgi:hypothetical protein